MRYGRKNCSAWQWVRQMSEFGKYGAIYAKVRALYGKRLTEEDFEKISAMKRVSQVADYLSAHPGWKDAMSLVPAGTINRGLLEETLRTQVMTEYIRLASFASIEDKKYLLFFIYRVDMDIILFTLRRLLTVNTLGGFPRIPDNIRRSSGVDYGKLSECKDFPGLLRAVEGSIYYRPLQIMARLQDSGLPRYSEAGTVLEGAYFSALYKFVTSRFTGPAGDVFRRSVGEKADFLNITRVMRIKKYFPDSRMQAREMLLPVYHKLKPEFFERLLSAPTTEAAHEILKASYYGKHFEKFDLIYIEQYYMLYIYNFNIKQIFATTPSVYLPMAYLMLKELEMHRLINIIECVRYGIAAGDAPVALNESMGQKITRLM